MVGHRQHRNPAEAKGQAAPERVAKVLARAGVASRREIERLIEAGRVALNGQTLTSPAIKVGVGDILTVDGAVVSAAEATRLFLYHKPAGLVTTHRDPKGRRTVFEALPAGLPRLISVGRLDLTSEGLLLLTNDGGLARALELPASGLKRRYRARALGRIDPARLDGLKEGITVEGVHYGPIEASLDALKEGPRGANLWITLTLAEGKNREVRRVLEALGLKVNRLIRVAYGPFALGTLAPGAVEEVAPALISDKLAGLIAPASLPSGDRPLFKPPPTAPAKPVARRSRPPPEPAPAKRKVYKPGWAKAGPPSGKRSGRRPPGPGR
jgi:23S rRNA pseudouridine2605 synthase